MHLPLYKYSPFLHAMQSYDVGPSHSIQLGAHFPQLKYVKVYNWTRNNSVFGYFSRSAYLSSSGFWL